MTTSQANRPWESVTSYETRAEQVAADARRTTAKQLQRTIREHGHPCRVNVDGTLTVASLGIVTTTGKPRWSTETIPAEYHAVYSWLGY